MQSRCILVILVILDHSLIFRVITPEVVLTLNLLAPTTVGARINP